MQVNWCIFYPFRTVAVTANNSVRGDIKSWEREGGKCCSTCPCHGYSTKRWQIRQHDDDAGLHDIQWQCDLRSVVVV